MNAQAAPQASSIGHEFQQGQLRHLASSERVPQAMLFAGPSGVGKRRIALELAAEILSRGTGHPIEHERQLVWSGNQPDLHILHREEEKKEITVDRMREFCSSMRLKPYQGTVSVWLIDNADEMNIAASNSLLMPLEEPPAHAKIILLSAEIHRIVPTIVSRCQPVFFGHLSPQELSRVLAGVCAEAGGAADPKLLGDLVKFARNSLAPFGLEPFLDPATGRVADGKGLTAHLEQLLAAVRSIRNRVERALSSDAQTAQLISVAAELAGEKEGTGLIWSTLRQIASEKLAAGTPKQISAWADALQAAVKSEQLVNERNLSPQIHLAEVLLQFGDARSS